MSAQNPHIPKYIKDAPWYAEKALDSDDYLAHHRSGKETQPNNEPRIGAGIKDDFIASEPIAVEFKRRKGKKKGRCANCGSNDHDKRDCLERPRSKRSAHDDVSVSEGKGKRNEDVDYDGKRDRWFGYNPEEYVDFAKKWEQRHELGQGHKDDEREFDTDEEIELKELGLWDERLKDDVKKADGEKIVRLREDRAVYLENIRDESVSYDPKSRTMRDDATGYYNEDNRFVRHLTGEAREFEDTKKFAWDEEKRGLGNDNFVANPTLADRKIKELSTEAKAKRAKLKKSLLDTYGEDEGTGSVPDPDDEDVVRSQYEEDVLLGNHTSVWGSYYENGRWGYRCCKRLDKNSVCI